MEHEPKIGDLEPKICSKSVKKRKACVLWDPLYPRVEHIKPTTWEKNGRNESEIGKREQFITQWLSTAYL